MSDAITPPRKAFTLNYSKSEIENKIIYICDKLPTYKFLSKNELLNTMRIESVGAFLSQHIDVSLDELEPNKTNVTIEITKSTGGMTNDDSILKAKKNMDEFTDFLSKTLSGYQINASDIQSVKKSKNNTMILYVVGSVFLIWFFLGGGMEMLFGLD